MAAKLSACSVLTSGLLVAATTMTPVLPSKPSISDSSWLMVCGHTQHVSKLQHFQPATIGTAQPSEAAYGQCAAKTRWLHAVS